MNENEIKKLKQEAQLYAEKIGSFTLNTNSQIDGFKNDYRKYYEYLVTASGIFAGLTQALLASSFQKIDILSILGFISFVIAVIFAFLGFRKGLTNGAKYTLGIKAIHGIFSDFSFEVSRFMRNEISPEEYKLKQEDFYDKRLRMRSNLDMGNADTYENSLLKEIINEPFSGLNLVTTAFLLGLILVALSVLIPQFSCLA